MFFHSDSSIDGSLLQGLELSWHKSRNKGHYNKNVDFFWVHWEVGNKDINKVKLHVECPKAAVDEVLNDLKKRIVADFLSPHFQVTAEQHDLHFKVGSRVKLEHQERFKCTSPFHIVLGEAQNTGDASQNIEKVDAILGDKVRAVIQHHQAELNQLFSQHT